MKLKQKSFNRVTQGLRGSVDGNMKDLPFFEEPTYRFRIDFHNSHHNSGTGNKVCLNYCRDCDAEARLTPGDNCDTVSFCLLWSVFIIHLS